MISSSFGLGTVIGPALAPLIILPYLGLPSPFFVFAAFGLLVLVTLKLRLPDDTPSYAARGRLVSEPMSSGSAGEVYDPQEHEAESEPAVPETARLSWRDARLRPWLIAGLVGGHANAMILGLVGFMLLDRLDLRARPSWRRAPPDWY